MEGATLSDSARRRRRSPRQRRLEREALARAGTRPLVVLLLGRTGRRADGGIGRSATMIRQALSSVGNIVRLRNVGEPLSDIPSDTDVIWHYGDFDHVDQQMAAAVEASIPMIINSTYDDRSDRRRWMIDLVERQPGGVYLVVFSNAAYRDPRLRRIWDRLVVLPKTIREPHAGASHDSRVKLPTWEQRDGICIGELEKLRRPRIVGDLDVDKAVAALQSRLNATVFVYNQYATTGTKVPEGAEVVCPGNHMSQWLSTKRLYVCFSRHETFAMVPAEAQSVGTPVLYRPMPQSLSEHIGPTGLIFDNLDELLVGAVQLYTQPRHWEQISKAGLLNARSRSVATAGASIDFALRKVVMRKKEDGLGG